MRLPSITCLLLLAALAELAPAFSYGGLQWRWPGGGGSRQHRRLAEPSIGGRSGDGYTRSLVVVRVKDGRGRTIMLQPANAEVTRRVVTGLRSDGSSHRTMHTVTTLRKVGGASIAPHADVAGSLVSRLKDGLTDGVHDVHDVRDLRTSMPRPSAHMLPPAPPSRPVRPAGKYMSPAPKPRPSAGYLPPVADGGHKSLVASLPARPPPAGKGAELPLLVARPGIVGIPKGAPRRHFEVPGRPQVVVPPQVTGRPQVVGSSVFTGVPDIQIPEDAESQPKPVPITPPAGRGIRRNLSGRADGSLFFGILPIDKEDIVRPGDGLKEPATLLSHRQGNCPLVDMTKCPVVPSMHPPACSNDEACQSRRRCCYDPCVAHNVCVLPVL